MKAVETYDGCSRFRAELSWFFHRIHCYYTKKTSPIYSWLTETGLHIRSKQVPRRFAENVQYPSQSKEMNMQRKSDAE